MQAVNLLPAYARPRSRWATAGSELSPARVLRLGAFAAAALAILLGGLYVHERSTVNSTKKDLAETSSRLAAAEAVAQPLRAAADGVNSRTSFINTVTAARVPWEKVMVGLAKVVPGQTYLQSLSVAAGTGAVSADVPVTPGTGGTLTITGTAASTKTVATVLDRLSLVPWLANVALVSSTSSSSAGVGNTFNITAGFVPLGVGK